MSSVVSTRTSVVLPAPLGPSSPRTVPLGTSRSTPPSARTVPKDFTTPRTTIAASPSVGGAVGREASGVADIEITLRHRSAGPADAEDTP